MRSPKPAPAHTQHPNPVKSSEDCIYSPAYYYHPPSPQRQHRRPNLPHQTSLNIASNPLRLQSIYGSQSANQHEAGRRLANQQPRISDNQDQYSTRPTRRSDSVPTFSVQFQDKKFETALLPSVPTDQTPLDLDDPLKLYRPEVSTTEQKVVETENRDRIPNPATENPTKENNRRGLSSKSRSNSPAKKSSSTSFLQKMGQKLSIDFHGSFQIVMLGLDNAGKSTTLYRLKMDNFIQAPPTIGFNCEKFKPSEGRSKGCLFTIWDVGGQEKLRPLWRSYVRHTDAIVFVVDSTDKDRFEEAKLELSNLMRCPDIPASVPILLVANKQDLPSAFTEEEVMAAVGVTELSPSHPNQILSCCAVTGEGLDGIFFDSLHQLVINSRKLDKGRKKSSAK